MHLKNKLLLILTSYNTFQKLNLNYLFFLYYNMIVDNFKQFSSVR